MKDENVYTVYMHITPDGKMYIGLTGKSPIIRWDFGRNYAHNRSFTDAIKKYSWKNIEHIIVAENLSADEGCQLEIDLIKWYDTTNQLNGYNIALGGKLGPANISEETREKMRVARSKRIYTEETKRKISESNSGSKNHSFGKKQSKECIAKRVKANSKPVLQFSTNMTFIKEWGSALEAGKHFGSTGNCITGCCKGRQKTAYGYTWRLKTDWLMKYPRYFGEDVV